MKNFTIALILFYFTHNISNAQPWMTNLDIAQSLAKVENKMVLMVWEEATTYPYHVSVNLSNGTTVIVENMFTDETISPLIWKHFVPVIVSENEYADLYDQITNKRNQRYVDKFNDDSIKIMDINGHILNMSTQLENFQNITTIIQKYALNTEFLANELRGYTLNKDFYSSYYLASKYLDFSMYINSEIRKEIVDLSNIYLTEATSFISENPNEEQHMLNQRVELLKLREYLIIERPKKVLRKLKRMNPENVATKNQPTVAFLYYTAHMILGDETKAEQWKSKISLVNLKKAQMLINLNS
ncbi:hypothetical protein [Winogradskyella bathintestinalis]|uniref:Uncharacterized protein n=1 Tax=Winogradskyella bathintestinalis TaxID=3035208 RepID=A0ABT7ZYM7_9FLAO|nr:hypothetical protein [Winogradskyella bathintestinalis]MDN3494104.1 hypothetical protein [Winogradskyella bathintestinalis]